MRKSLFAGALLLCATALADPIDGYVSPIFSYTGQLSSVESGTRFGGRLEFGRLGRNVAIDLRASKGLSYSDYGATLRFFGHLRPRKDIGISLGMGAGAMYSATNPTTSSSGTISDDGRKFVDVIVNPFARILYDSDLGFGASAELGFDLVPLRHFNVDPKQDTTFRNRLVFSIGFVFDV